MQPRSVFRPGPVANVKKLRLAGSVGFLFLLLIVSLFASPVRASMEVASSSAAGFAEDRPRLNPSLEGERLYVERTLIIETPDPCKKILGMIPKDAKGRLFTFGKVSLSGDTFFLSACAKMRADLEGAAQEWLKDISGYSAAKKQFDAGVEAIKREVYVTFLQFVAMKMYEQLPPEEQAKFAPNSPEAIDHALEWLHQPENEIKTYVHAFLEAKAKPLARLFRDYMSGASMEIITGLKDLMQGARDKLKRFTEMQRKAEETDTAIGDLLEEFGFSGEYLDRFKAYENKIKSLNKSYKVTEAVGIIAGAFQTDVPDRKIAGMMDLLVLVGGVAEDSNIPIVSLFGQIVKAYGEVGKEMLGKVLALEKLLREREGYCIGLATHSRRDPKNTAFIEAFGQGIRACPITPDGHLKDVFVQAQPEDNGQLYFWAGGKFIKGRAGGGGERGMRRAIGLIQDGERLNYPGYTGKAKDLETIAAVYNTPYPKEGPRGKNHSGATGVMGLIEESGLVIEAIDRQIRALRSGTDEFGEPSCADEKVDSWIEKETGQSVSRFMDRIEMSRQDLKDSYALAFVDQYRTTQGAKRTAAYKTYSRFFDKIEKLSIFKIHGRVVDREKPDRACPKCANASISVSPSNAQQMPQCKVTHADAKGRFVIHLVTQSSQVTASLSASAGNVSSDTLSVEPEKLGFDLSQLPFVESFSLTLPLEFGEEGEEEGGGGKEKGPLAADVLTQLEVLASQAESLSGQITTACQSLSDLGALEADVDRAQSGLPGLRTRLSAAGNEIRELDRKVQALRQKSKQASGLAEDIVTFRKSAEGKALFACEQAELLQKKQGDPAVLVPRAEAAGREAQSLSQKASQHYQKVRQIAAEVSAQAKTIGGLGEEARAVQRSAAELTGALEQVQPRVNKIEQALAAIGEHRGELNTLKGRGEAFLAQGKSAAGGEGSPGDLSARLDAAYGRIVAAINRATPCEQGAAERLVSVKSKVSAVNAEVQELQPQITALNEAAARSGQVALGDAVAETQAVADTGEVFAEAAQQVAVDAQKCVALARAMTKDGPEKIAQTAKVAIAQCEFGNAKKLIAQLGSDPARPALEALYHERARHEGRTKTLFAQANQLFKDRQYEPALGLLKEARGHTKCEKFVGKIDEAITRIEAVMTAQEEEQEKPGQQQANAQCAGKKAGSVAVWDDAAKDYKCSCPQDRVLSPEGNSCIERSAVAGTDTDLQPEEPETFAVAFRLYILTPTSEPKTLEIPKGADSKTRKRIKEQNEIILKNFVNGLSLSNTRPRAVEKMETPMVIAIGPGAQEKYPMESFVPGEKYSIPFTGTMPGEKGPVRLNTALLMEVIRTYGSTEEVMAAFPQAKNNKNKRGLDSKRLGELLIQDESGTFTINDPQSGKITVGPLTKGWTSQNRNKSLQLTKQIYLMAGAITCFVATAVYEDPLASQLTVLRSFRDQFLMDRASGERLVRLYYRYGPGWAEWVKAHPSLASPLQTVFDSAVAWLQSNNLKGTWQGDVVDALVRTADAVSSWFTDDEDYESPASGGGLLHWLGLAGAGNR